MSVIEYRNINLKFKEQVLFKDFNLVIEKGEKVLLSAQSGSGKTTLIKMLMGFIQPDSGEISVDGVLLSEKNVSTVRKKITYISQDADIPKGVVGEVFKEVFSFHANRHIDYNQTMLINHLSEFSLPAETVEKQVDDLSGGERQRLAMIMGILLDREICVLDEITTGLDLALKEKAVSRLMSLQKTMLIISHDEVFKDASVREVRWP
ncbi:ATP-binding cassette domain-containing protein [Eubacteriaceae bacterium ES3]|nr:ATP-binding cassette domain-containing protein [Eubacteriaceae bacterium ES3]